MMARELITDPNAAKAELELDAAATKRDVLNYVKNHHLNNVHPMFSQLAKTLQSNFDGIRGELARVEKQRDQIAMIFNNLVDFLEQDGFRVGKDGRVRLNQQEFQAFVKKRAAALQKAQAAPASSRPS